MHRLSTRSSRHGGSPTQRHAGTNYVPVGRGKKLLGGANGVADKLLSGWQIAGTGNRRTTYFALPTNLYQTTGQKIEVYGYKYPIEDCRSGACFPGYLWWNGYIPTTQINSHDAAGHPNGVMGVPANYKPAAQYLIPAGSTALPPNAPAGTNIRSNWDTNNVWIPLSNGTVQRVAYNDGINPWRNQYMPGPIQWFLDASAVKNTNITERVVLRFNVDFFNALNNPNNPAGLSSATNAILSTRNSGSAARSMQLGARLIW